MSNRSVLLLCGFLMAVPLLGRSKTDVIVMINGDRLTCEIKKLDHGVLYASLDYVDGTISIEWSKVARLESSQLFVVETEGGATYTGTLKTVESLVDQPRKIEIAEAQHQREAVVEQSKVVVADQFGDSIWRRFHGTVSSGLIYSKGSDTMQYNLASELSFRKERSLLQLSYSSAFSISAGSTQTTRNQLDLNGQRLLRWNNWYYAGAASFLQSSSQGINYQSVYGGGIGRYLKNTNSARISLTGGLALQDTQYSHRPTESNLVGLIAAELYVFRFKKYQLTVTPVLLPVLTDPGRVRFNLNAQYNVQMISDLWWNISFYGNWDNRPPVGFVGSDYGTSMGFTYSFH